MTNLLHPVHEPKVRALESDIEVHEDPKTGEPDFQPDDEPKSKSKRRTTED